MGRVKEHYFEAINAHSQEDYEYQFQQWLENLEKWVDIPNYEGLYQVSDMGRVKSLKRVGDIILKPCINSHGYYYVSLYKNYKRKIYRIHKLVAMAFLGHKPDGTHSIVVDHINNDKSDNSVENLQLITQRHNVSKHVVNVTSKYVGVSWDKRINKWVSQIRINGKQIHIGYFTSEMEAGLEYQRALSLSKMFDGDVKKFRKLLQNEN